MMILKRLECLFAICICLSVYIPVFGQITAIERVQENALKYKQANLLKIAIPNKACSSVWVDSKAEVEYVDDCFWTVTPNELLPPPGLEISIYLIQNGDTIHIEDRHYRVEILDPLVTHIGQYYDLDTIPLNDLRKQSAIRSFAAEGKYGCLNVRPQYFKYLIHRGQEVINFGDNQGNEFNLALKEQLEQLAPGDQLLFYDFSFGSLDSQYRTTQILRLTIE